MASPQPTLWEDCPRHNGNKNSVAANEQVFRRRDDQKARLHALLSVAPMCIHDLKVATGWDANQFSGRLTAMKSGSETQWPIVEVGTCEHEHRAAMYRAVKQ